MASESLFLNGAASLAAIAPGSALHKCHLYWVCRPLEIGFCASCGSVVKSSQAFSFITRRPPATKSPWPILAMATPPTS